jgi:hypothetical protein
MKKINGFFVASKIYETTTFKSNNKSGFVDHNVRVSKKKYLIYSTIDENGVIRYFEYDTGNPVKDNTMNRSFINKADTRDVNYYSYMDTLGLGSKTKMRTRFEKEDVKFGFFMPLDEYVNMVIPFYHPNVKSPFKAKALVKLLNGITIGKIELNRDKEIAKKQLEEIGCYKPKVKVKTKEEKKETYAKAA